MQISCVFSIVQTRVIRVALLVRRQGDEKTDMAYPGYSLAVFVPDRGDEIDSDNPGTKLYCLNRSLFYYFIFLKLHLYFHYCSKRIYHT